MLLEKQRLMYVILKIIANSQIPVGSGFICDNLNMQGFNISEATTGRILRELDIKGYTEKIGFKGRNLTPSGQKKLKELEHEHRINHYGNELVNAIKVTGKHELLDILIARKAIESQLAKLAAQFITAKEIQEMEEIISEQQEHVDKGISIADDDIRFHKAIAKAAKNRVLDAAMDLIRQHGQISPILEYIRKEVRSTVLLDHKNIFEAIISKNADMAEKAMIRHIENLAKDVKRYWEIVNNDDNFNGNN